MSDRPFQCYYRTDLTRYEEIRQAVGLLERLHHNRYDRAHKARLWLLINNVIYGVILHCAIFIDRPERSASLWVMLDSVIGLHA